MSDGPWWFLGGVCAGFAALQFVFGCWACVDLWRRWRSVPDRWRVEWRDVSFRLERDFGVLLTRDDFTDQPIAWVELTAGQLWGKVAVKVGAAGSEVGADGWERFVAALAEVLGVQREWITPGILLFGDLR